VLVERARFAVWTDRARLYGVIARETRIDVGAFRPTEMEVVLHAGARVRKLAHRDGATQVRYLGALEVDGWVPDDALADRGEPHTAGGRVPTGRQTLMVMPGAVIRTEPQWAGRELAVMANG